MVSDLCMKCIYCIKYGYMHYSMGSGKKILIGKCFKCEKTIDIDLEIAKCRAFKEKPKSNSKHFKEAKQTANKGKKPRKQPKKGCKHKGCTNNPTQINDWCSLHQEDEYT